MHGRAVHRRRTTSQLIFDYITQIRIIQYTIEQYFRNGVKADISTFDKQFSKEVASNVFVAQIQLAEGNPSNSL